MKVIPKFLNSGKTPTRLQIELNKKKLLFLNLNGVKVRIDGSWGPWQLNQYNKIKSKLTKPRLNWFTRSMIGAAMAENPAVMTASGWQQDKLGNYVLKRTKGSDQLADNLATISWMAPTHPGNIIIDLALKRVAFPATAFLGNKALKGTKQYLPTVYSFGEKAVKGTSNALSKGELLAALAIKLGRLYVTQTVDRGKQLTTLAIDNIGNSEYFPFFMRTSNSFTRGIGRGNYGILDLVESGIVRGNPRGTEVTAHYFAKLWRRNRNHFRDIMRDTKIPGIENKFFSRTLTEEEFNAIKQSAKKYSPSSNLDMIEIGLDNKIRFVPLKTDPLVEYPTYKDYVKAVDDLIKQVNDMQLKVSNGLVEVNSTLTRDPTGVLRGRPINERFGVNSDYVADGTPLSYWYSDGRNALTRGYDYAGSDWMVKVNNVDKYLPFMHEAHLHHSLMVSPRLNDPNVTVYRRVFPGISLKVPKKYLYKKFGRGLYSLPVRSPYYRYYEDGTIEFDMPKVVSAIKKGRLDFIDEMLSELYREAARNNMIEAQNMGLEYTPVYEKEGFKSLVQDGITPKFVKSTAPWEAATSWFGGTLGRRSEITYNVIRPTNIRNATAHEVGHVSSWGMGSTPKLLEYMKYKTNQLFKNNGDVGVYEFGSLTGEGATNMRDLGREMGITLETPYPGYEEALRRLEEAKSYSTKGGIVDVLRLDKEHMPYIWKALQGLHYSIAPIGFGVASYSNND